MLIAVDRRVIRLARCVAAGRRTANIFKVRYATLTVPYGTNGTTKSFFKVRYAALTAPYGAVSTGRVFKAAKTTGCRFRHSLTQRSRPGRRNC